MYPVFLRLQDCIILEEYIESGVPLGYMTEFDFNDNKINRLLEKYPEISEKIGYYDFNDSNLLLVNDTVYLLNTKLDCFFNLQEQLVLMKFIIDLKKIWYMKTLIISLKNIMNNLLNK